MVVNTRTMPPAKRNFSPQLKSSVPKPIQSFPNWSPLERAFARPSNLNCKLPVQ